MKLIIRGLLAAGALLSSFAKADSLLDTVGNTSLWETYDWAKPISEEVGQKMMLPKKGAKQLNGPLRTIRSAQVDMSGTPFSLEQLAPDGAPGSPYFLLLIAEQQRKCDGLLAWAQSHFGLPQRTLDTSSTMAPDELIIGGNLTEEKWFQWDIGTTRAQLFCSGLTEKLSETSWAPRGGGAFIRFGPPSIMPTLQPLVGYDCEYRYVPSSPDDPVPPIYGFFLDYFRGIARTAYRTPIGSFRQTSEDVIEFGEGLSTDGGFFRRVNLKTGEYFLGYGKDASPQTPHGEGKCVRTESPTKLK